MKIKKGDTVMVIVGKDRGKTAKVLRALPQEDHVIVEGINMVKKHQRRTANNRKEQTFEALKGDLGFTNVMEAPKVSKVIVSCGVGTVKDPKRRAFIEERLARITGQHPSSRGAKKSIANFKSRTGDTVGFQVTLRGARLEAFLNKIIHIVLPRVKDFRGITSS